MKPSNNKRNQQISIVYANDNDAVDVYELNFGIGTIDNKDIRMVNAEDIPYGDILLAGFPCTPFSTAGKRNGVKDPKGLLYKECMRIIEVKQPKVFDFAEFRAFDFAEFRVFDFAEFRAFLPSR